MNIHDEIYTLRMRLQKISALALTPVMRNLADFLILRVKRNPLIPGHLDLAVDLWHLFFYGAAGASPKVKRRMVNTHLLEVVRNDERYPGALARTRTDITAAVITASTIYDWLMTNKAIEKLLEYQEQLAEAYQKLAEAVGGGLEGERLDNAEQLVKEMQASLERAMGEAATQALTEDTVAQAMEESLETARDISQAADFIGYGQEMGFGMKAPISPEDVNDFVTKYDELIRQITQAVGLMRGAAISGGALVTDEVTPFATITQVTDLGSVLTSEIIGMLGNDDSLGARVQKALTLQSLLDGNLLGLQSRSTNKREGNFYCVIDGSGSMGLDGFTLASCLALGVGMMASERGREYGLAVFSYHDDDWREINHESTWEEKLEWAGHFPGGGTDFDAAIRNTMRMIEKLPSDEPIEILFVTDGIAPLSEETKQAWKDFRITHHCRMLLVSITSGMGEIDDIADRILELSALDWQNAQEIASMLGKWIAE